MTQTCIDVYKNLNIQIINESIAISPCCLIQPVVIKNINFEHDPLLTQFRKVWDNGIFPQQCNGCKHAEQSKYPSRRRSSNQWYIDHDLNNTDVELIRLDYWTGDTCNLRCVICSPDNSSAWKEELQIPIVNRTSNINTTWTTLDISKLKFIHFNGGEPLLSKEHIKFLEEVPHKNQVHLNYNTNGTILPTSHLLELWSKFKLVQLDFSIDDINERFEYQRYPAKWDLVKYNLQWYIDNAPVNCMFATNTTVSILNEPYLNELSDWLITNFNVNRVTDPIEHRHQPASGLFENTNNPDDIIKFLNGCDARRNTNWRLTFPSLAKTLI